MGSSINSLMGILFKSGLCGRDFVFRPSSFLPFFLTLLFGTSVRRPSDKNTTGHSLSSLIAVKVLAVCGTFLCSVIDYLLCLFARRNSFILSYCYSGEQLAKDFVDCDGDDETGAIELKLVRIGGLYS